MLLKDYIESAKIFANETKDWKNLNEMPITPPTVTAGKNPAITLLVALTSAGHSTRMPKKSKKKLVSILSTKLPTAWNKVLTRVGMLISCRKS